MTRAGTPDESSAHVRPRMPPWLRRPTPSGGHKNHVEKLLREGGLHTVCEEARCPNRGECFGRGTATFLILGDVCTRSCRFCGVSKGPTGAVDETEAARLAQAAVAMKLSYVVITSVTRDDLPDGGASQFAAVIRELRRGAPGVGIEVLIPDFRGDASALATVLEAAPDVLNHNVETVPRLYRSIRPQADFEQSIELLRRATADGRCGKVKSGLMVGLGERAGEVETVLERLAGAGCSIVTIGQYLQPTGAQVPVAEFVAPEHFESYAEFGRKAGIAHVISGPFIRSSYRAEQAAGEDSPGS